MSKKSSAVKGYAIVNVTDTGDGLLISDADIERYGLQYDKHYEGEFLPDGRYKIALPYPAMTNAKPELVEQLKGRAQFLEDRGEVKSPGLLREACALILQLTAERDKWRDAWMKSAHDEAEAIRERDEMTSERDALAFNLRDEKTERQNTLKNLVAWKAKAEAAEKRAKELKEGRDLDKVVLDEGIEIINELESSNKLLSERVAVLETALEPFAKFLNALILTGADKGDDEFFYRFNDVGITFGDLRLALAAREAK